jgi:hypothetical protein
MPKATKVNTSLPKDAQADKEYFSKVEKDVQRILRQEHIQEEYRKVSVEPPKRASFKFFLLHAQQYATGSVLSAQHQRELQQKDGEIAQLHRDNKGLTVSESAIGD